MKLQITRRTELALRALQLLGSPGRHKSAAIAEGIGSTPAFVAQVVQHLVTARWVRSDPGPTGGYTLVVPLGSISLFDLIEATEGPTDDGQCVLHDRNCAAEKPCPLHEPWQRARTSLIHELQETPLDSLAPLDTNERSRPNPDHHLSAGGTSS